MARVTLPTGNTSITKAQAIALVATASRSAIATGMGPVKIRWHRNASNAGLIDGVDYRFTTVQSDPEVITEVLEPGTTNWTAPANLYSVIFLGSIGAGGRGADGVINVSSGASGGTGEFRSSNDLAPIVPGATFDVQVAAGSSELPTYLKIPAGRELIRANAGTNASGITPGVGGSGGVGALLNYNGTDGTAGANHPLPNFLGSSGGPGAPGPNGLGKKGGLKASGRAGAGGGGANGGLSTVGEPNAGGNSTGGSGGKNRQGEGIGLAGGTATLPQVGIDGAGSGGAGAFNSTNLGKGAEAGFELIWTRTSDGKGFGPGGGPGGSLSQSGDLFAGDGAPGKYGSGGAGGASTATKRGFGGTGGDAFIVIRYITGPLPAARSDVLTPALLWSGEGDSGWSSGTAPVATTRGANPQPWLNELFVPNQTFDKDFVLAFQSGSRDGLEKVVFYCEGNSIEVTEKTWHQYTDANGQIRFTFGYHATLSHVAAMSANPRGTLHVWVRAVPLNKPTFEDRVMGPYPLHPRTTLYDAELQVGAGFPYTTINQALTYVGAQTRQNRYKIKVMQGGNWKIDQVATAYARPVSVNWTTICAAAGVNVTIGSGGTTLNAAGEVQGYTKPGIDMIHFQGSNIKWDLCQMGSDFGGFYNTTLATDCKSWTWCDGMEITQGTPVGGIWNSGSGATALQNGKEAGALIVYPLTLNGPNIYFTEVNAHDLSARGLGNSRLIRHCELNRTSGSMIETMGRRSSSVGGIAKDFAIHGLNCSIMGGYDPSIGLATPNPAVTMTYTGSAAYVAFDKFAKNHHWQLPLQVTDGGSGYVNGVYGTNVGADTPITFTGGTGTGLRGKITVAGGVVTACEVTADLSSDWGLGYTVGDIVTATVPGGGTGLQVRIGGNFRVWAGANSGDATIVHEYIIQPNLPVQTFVDHVNTWSDFTATNDQTANKFAMTNLTVADVAVSAAVPKREVTGSPKKIVLCARLDIHSNVIAFPSVEAINGSFFGVKATNHMGGSPFSASGGLKDVGRESCSWNDVGYKVEPELGIEGGYQTGAQSHVVDRYNTMVHGFVYGAGAAREFCSMENCYAESHGAQIAGVGMEIKNCLFLKAPKPAASDVNTVLLGYPAYKESDIFVAPTWPKTDIRPKLQPTGNYLTVLANGQQAGLYDTNGNRRFVNDTSIINKQTISIDNTGTKLLNLDLSEVPDGSYVIVEIPEDYPNITINYTE